MVPRYITCNNGLMCTHKGKYKQSKYFVYSNKDRPIKRNELIIFIALKINKNYNLLQTINNIKKWLCLSPQMHLRITIYKNLKSSCILRTVLLNVTFYSINK